MARLSSATNVHSVIQLGSDTKVPGPSSMRLESLNDVVSEAIPERTEHQITIVYKRRHHNDAPKTLPENVTSTCQVLTAKASEVGIRQSIRIKNILQGFRFGSPSRQDAMQSMHVGSSHNAKRKCKGVVLPAHPSLQDFINVTTAGMFQAPLSIGQIQHSTIHICDIDAAQVSDDKILADPVGDSQMLLLLGPAPNDKEDH
ncbi:hypothetical protein GUJ93_ZPchr0010g9944 [Zizania palustris]|uniref:Uncharacterized protein n=1 Tax=Zizania palustris TaxID=103762 RepID=A0A8J5WE71_ZIZPA|nr:hypothetical protein GUJ93_ZPchr0010g9944 [Zizania palustris]